MAQLSVLRQQLRRRFGLAPAEEDAFFNDDALTDALNEAHRMLAEECRLYRVRQTYDLPVGSSGTSTVALECNLLELVPDTVEAEVGGTWRRLEPIPEEYLRTLSCEPLTEADNGEPCYYFLRAGDDLPGTVTLELYPGASTAVTGGLKLDAWVYPPLLQEDTDTPSLQPGQHRELLPPACLFLAEMALGEGRPDAPALLQYWERRTERAVARLKGTVEAGRRSGTRTIHRTEDDW